MCHTRENRQMDMLTVSSRLYMSQSKEPLFNKNLFPMGQRPFKFDKRRKKYVMITARVHPGETPGSHVFNGVLKFLLNKSEYRAKVLRNNFVFILIPMLNPDGVYRGHYRVDTQGNNLNRFYKNPTHQDQPTIYATRQVFLNLHQQRKLFFYCDLHAHASKKGIFLIGNSQNFKGEVQSQLFTRLWSMNNKFFECKGSNFRENNMMGRDKNDNLTKENCGRYALFQESKLPHCYTLEAHYTRATFLNTLYSDKSSKSKRNQKGLDIKFKTEHELEKFFAMKYTKNKRYCPTILQIEDFEDIGKSLCIAILDLVNLNPISRILSTPFRNLNRLRFHTACYLLSRNKFQKNSSFYKLYKHLYNNIDILQNFLNSKSSDFLQEEVIITTKERELQLIYIYEEDRLPECLQYKKPNQQKKIRIRPIKNGHQKQKSCIQTRSNFYKRSNQYEKPQQKYGNQTMTNFNYQRGNRLMKQDTFEIEIKNIEKKLKQLKKQTSSKDERSKSNRIKMKYFRSSSKKKKEQEIEKIKRDHWKQIQKTAYRVKQIEKKIIKSERERNQLKFQKTKSQLEIDQQNFNKHHHLKSSFSPSLSHMNSNNPLKKIMLNRKKKSSFYTKSQNSKNHSQQIKINQAYSVKSSVGNKPKNQKKFKTTSYRKFKQRKEYLGLYNYQPSYKNLQQSNLFKEYQSTEFPLNKFQKRIKTRKKTAQKGNKAKKLLKKDQQKLNKSKKKK